MNKKMREILAKIEEKTAQAKAFMADDTKDIEKANKALDEVEALKKEFETEKRLFEATKDVNTPTVKEVEDKNKEKTKENSTKEFAKMARMGFKAAAGTPMTEGTMADGGYVVPQDIQTKINEYRDSKFSLRQLVRVEPVKTKSGSRTYKTKAQMTGFTKVGEKENIGAVATPTFERVEYSIDKYAGYLPITNELLNDSDSNIENTAVEWLGDEARVTDNNNIITEAKTFTNKVLTEAGILDEIKTILNVDLGQAYKPVSAIVTNDNGLNVLDKLKDSDGKYLLSPVANEPMKMQLSAGANVIPVHVLPNKDLADDSTKGIPFFIGSMYDAITLFDRQQITINTSNVAVVGTLNAFEDDLTIWRGMLREDVEQVDSNALFYATLKLGE